MLEGASALLARTEVLVAEFWMFPCWNEPMTILPDLIAMLDARSVTALRTGAVAPVAARALAREGASVVVADLGYVFSSADSLYAKLEAGLERPR